MKLAYNIKMSTYRLLIKRGLTIEKMRKRDFGYADFSSANFSSANFSSANFRYADFSSANFSSANFRYANFSSANFRYADFRYADFRYANFSSADFGSANFGYANFSSADFGYANFRSANFRYADFGSANLPKGFYPLSLPGRNWAREIFIVGDTLHIGCQRHLIESWMKFSGKEISGMDDDALRWWTINKPILVAIIEQVKQS